MRVFLLFLGLAAAAAMTPPDNQRVGVCEARIDQLEKDLRSSMIGTPPDRSEVLNQVQVVIGTLAGEVSPCAARVRNVEMTLVGKTDDLVELDSVLSSFFEGPLLEAAPPWVVSRFYRQRGYALERRGQTTQSAQSYFKAATLARQIDAVNGARALFDAALSARDVGKRTLAMAYIEEARQLLNDSLSAASPKRRGDLESTLGNAYALRGEILYGQFEQSLSGEERRRLGVRILEADRQAIERLRVSPHSFDKTRQVYVFLHDARVRAFLGDIEGARRSLASATRLAKAQSEGVAFPQVAALLATGEVERIAGNLEAAASVFEKARREAVGIGDRDLEGQSLERLGRVREAQGQTEGASDAYREAIRIQEARRERIGLREWSASAFHRQQEPYRGLARMLLAQHDPTGALAALDASHARAFRDLRRSRHVRLALPDGRRQRVEALLDSLESARLQATLSERSRPQLSHTNARIVAYEDSLEQVLGVAPLAAPPLDVSAVQTALRPSNRTLVVYSLDEVQSTAYVVRGDTLAAIMLPAGEGAIAAQATAMVSAWQRGAPDPSADLEAAHALYESVFEPLEHLLPEGGPVTFVPDGALVNVPFAMLLRHPSESYAEADFVVRHHATSTELAASLLQETYPTHPSRPLSALGLTSFDGGTAMGVRSRDMSPLPHVREEIRSVGAHASERRTALDAEATEVAFKALSRGAGIIHLATHAVVDPELPLNSYIVLSGDAEGADDGLLHLHEIQNEDISADLVVLSGCSTARGDAERGEGLMGFGYAVRAAGAAASIATLWAVDDRATVFLMDKLYDGLAGGLPKDEALRRAQLAYLDSHDGLEASPFFWAAPILSGAPGPIPLGEPRRWWIWVALLGLAGALAWAYTRRTA